MADAQGVVEQLVDVGRRIAGRDLVIGSGGNSSVRTKQAVWIKASGRCFRDADPAAYVPIDPGDGRPLSDGHAPSVERWMHLACYDAREDVHAVIHCHPPWAVAWAATGEDLAAFSPEMASHFGERVPVLPYAPPGSDELAASVGRAVADGAEGLLLAQHGTVVVAGSLLEAFDRACVLEAACRTAAVARLLGPGIRPFTPEETRHVRERLSYRSVE